MWTPEADTYLRARYDPGAKGRAHDLAIIFGIPRWNVNRRATQLGLSRMKERRWTLEENAELEQLLPSMSIHNLAKHFGRSRNAIILKSRRLGLRKRDEGYTASSLARALGVDDKWVTARIASGKLHAGHRQTERTHTGDYYLITDADVLAMIREHPYEIEIRKVDRYWFMDLIVPSLKPAKNGASR